MRSNESPVGVLVVANNDEAVLQTVSSTLAKAGFVVTGASNVAAAIHRSRECCPIPEMAVIDATIPGIDLEDLVFQLHQVAPGIRLLFLAGDVPNDVLRSLRARWRATVLNKPFRRSQLLGQILTLRDEPMVLTA